MVAPLLTVIIPTRNRHALLEHAVRSAVPNLAFPFEVIVSDNASSDTTSDIARQYPTVSYRKRDTLIPMAEHWNLCVKEAKGKYIKVLCDDDWLFPGALELEVLTLEENEKLVAVASARREVSADGAEQLGIKGFHQDTILEGSAIFKRMLKDENILGPPSAVMFRRDKFQGFPAQYAYAADWAAWILLADQGPVKFLAERNSAFRLHDSNLTEKFVEDGTDFVEVMALRRECLRRLRTFRFLTGATYFAKIFCYRFGRRFFRLILRGKNPTSFFGRAIFETRQPLRKIP